MNIIHVLIAVPAALAFYAAALTVIDVRKQALKSADQKIREAKEAAKRKEEALSPAQKIAAHLSSLGWEGPVFPLALGMSSAIVIAAVALRTFGIPPLATIVLGFPTAGLFASFVSNSIRAKRREMFATQMTSAFDTIASQLRQGSSLSRVLKETYPSFPEPLHSEIAFVVDKVERGVPLPEALAEVEERYPSPAITLFVAAVRAAEERGGRIAPAMEQAASSLREEQELAAEGSADVSMERFQFGGIVLLVIFLCGSAVLGADADSKAAYSSPAGIATLTFASIWFSLGVFSVLRMLNSIKGGKK